MTGNGVAKSIESRSQQMDGARSRELNVLEAETG